MAEKRRSTARPRGAPSAKKARVSTPAKEPTPVVEVAEEETRPTPLPNKLVESRGLPTMSEAQPVVLSDEDYQSVASSAVLVASLDRSRRTWVSGDFFERYWTKPKSKKDAAPPPPNNPHKSWMKETGICSITVEPVIFEAMVFVVREPGTPVPTAFQQAAAPRPAVQYAPPPGLGQSAYGTPYRPQQLYQPAPPAQQAYYQPRPLPPVLPASTPDNRAPPPPGIPARSNAPPPPTTPAPTTTKPSPDPVIQMLATRASTDPELKSLMRIVATGSADPEQLKVFQRHIDELTAIIANNKQKEESVPPPPQAIQQYAPSPSTGYSSANGTPRPLVQASPCGPPPYPMSSVQPMQHIPMPRPVHQPISQAPPRYPTTQSLPVVLEFHGTFASSDRFLFPPHSILEAISPISILASFLVFRKGKDAVEAANYDAETEYYEPVTMTISVADTDKGREVVERVKLSVKPQEEVRKWMEEKMKTCKRADRRYLALRLPHKSQLSEEDMIEEIPVVEVKKKAPKKEKAIDKQADQSLDKTLEKQPDQSLDKTLEKQPDQPSVTQPGQIGRGADQTASGEVVVALGEDKLDDGGSKEEPESGNRRSSRSTRKSVRISEV